jgi:quinol monooxygenase YgiN
MVRLAKIKVDPLQLNNYNIALKEQMTTAVRLEPGVLTYYAMIKPNHHHTSQYLKYMLIQRVATNLI